jgi:predicted DNA-binding transcriptional regulator YafY
MRRSSLMNATAAASPAGRLLALLSLLEGRRDWPGPELARRLEVSERTVRRDVDRLRGLGYPIDSVGGRAGGYALRAGAAMPPLLLDDVEAIAIAVGLRTAAASSAIAGIAETALRALVKLEQVLPSHLRRRVSALSGSTSVLGLGEGPSVDPQYLSVLAAATRDHEMVRFAYQSRTSETTRRTVEPHALVSHGRRWYLVAFDPARQGWRTFRADRIQQLTADGTRFRARTIPGRSAAAFVSRAISERAGYEAKVTYHAPAGTVRQALLRVRDPGEITPLDENTCTRRILDHDLDFLVLRIAIAGAPFSVTGPPELMERLRVWGQRFTAALDDPH